MNTKFTKPKGFGEILDHTFSLTKDHFKNFFIIFLIFMAPIFLIEAIIQLASGTSFFRETGQGSNWFEQMLSSFEQSGTFDSSSLTSDLALILTGLVSFFLYPVAEGAILFALNHIRKDEQYTVGQVIKQAFGRYWPMLGSSILFGLIAFGIAIIPLILVGVAGGVTAAFIHPVVGVLIGILFFLGAALGIGLLLTRWSFYFGSVVLDQISPGLSRSWRLSKKQTWKLFGLYIVFYMIISAVSFAVEMSFGLLLGGSVLLSIIRNIITLFTTMFFSVGYGVMYLDLKLRHDADDLKELIDDYNTPIHS
ncbi:hypothetical protein [Neobacillus sp. LXY-1]|uniref:hypothetical protein n=1 Tax=Neobacillus sp. LXY-1 TaxID=3379133 RepID=UPI003EDF93A3